MNWNGRITYLELADHLNNLGFSPVRDGNMLLWVNGDMDKIFWNGSAQWQDNADQADIDSSRNITEKLKTGYIVKNNREVTKNSYWSIIAERVKNPKINDITLSSCLPSASAEYLWMMINGHLPQLPPIDYIRAIIKGFNATDTQFAADLHESYSKAKAGNDFLEKLLNLQTFKPKKFTNKQDEGKKLLKQWMDIKRKIFNLLFRDTLQSTEHFPITASKYFAKALNVEIKIVLSMLSPWHDNIVDHPPITDTSIQTRLIAAIEKWNNRPLNFKPSNLSPLLAESASIADSLKQSVGAILPPKNVKPISEIMIMKNHMKYFLTKKDGKEPSMYDLVIQAGKPTLKIRRLHSNGNRIPTKKVINDGQEILNELCPVHRRQELNSLFLEYTALCTNLRNSHRGK